MSIKIRLSFGYEKVKGKILNIVISNTILFNLGILFKNTCDKPSQPALRLGGLLKHIIYTVNSTAFFAKASAVKPF